MTTNHPAHGPVLLARLHQIREILSKAAAQSDGGNLGYAMADAVKVIDEVLEARNAEPVVLDETQSRAAFEKWCSVNIERNKWHPEFYAHLPAREQWAAWEACRAAMLNHSGDAADMVEPVSNSDELPLDYLQGHKDGLEWAAQLAEANHPQTGDWLCDDPIELARAIRKGPDMPEFKSVSVDEDDNFYSWFGRFWYENYQKNNYTTSAKQMLGAMAEFAYRAGRESAALAGNSPVIPDGWQLVPKEPTEAMNKAGWAAINEHDAINPTYRAMLAAAPQQENV